MLRRGVFIASLATAAALTAAVSASAQSRARAAPPAAAAPVASANAPKEEILPFGLISKVMARPGKRDDLIEAMIEGSANMPGCLSYIVSKDSKDPSGVWVSEIWRTKKAHDDSLTLPAVKASLTRARPLIAGTGESHEVAPVGGQLLGGAQTSEPPPQ